MNNYAVFVNGLLTNVSEMRVESGVSVVDGTYVDLFVPGTWKAPGKELMSIDVFEYRSGSCTRRMRYATEEDREKRRVRMSADDFLVYRCLSVPNAF